MANAPIDVRTYALERRKALAQKIAALSGARGGLGTNRGAARGSFGGGGNQTPQLTFPFLQTPGQAQGLGAVNSASPSDPFAGSTSPGMPAQAPNQSPGPGTPDASVSGAPVLAPTAPMLPQVAAGTGTYASGALGHGIYGGGSENLPKPIATSELLRQLMLLSSGAQFKEAAPYGGGGTGSAGTMRF